MMLVPGERITSIEEQRQKIRNILCKNNQIILVAEHKNELIRYLGLLAVIFKEIATASIWLSASCKPTLDKELVRIFLKRSKHGY